MLIWNGTTWVIPNAPAQNPTGLELITSCTANFVGGTAGSVSNGVVTLGSGNTSVTVSNAFSATYDNYKIMVSGGTGTQNSELALRLGSTTSNYFYSYIYTAWNNTVAADASKVGTRLLYAGGMMTDGIQANIELNSPFLAKNTRMFAGGFGDSGSYVGAVSGLLANTTQYTSFDLFPSAGSMAGATIRVYGYRN
jgi:hypothetical protein